MSPGRNTALCTLLLALACAWSTERATARATGRSPLPAPHREDRSLTVAALMGRAHTINSAIGAATVRERIPFQTSPPNLKDSKLIAEGDSTFARTCSIPYCHGKDGSAGRAPALRDRNWEASQLHKIISGGIPNTSMPNFEDKLSAKEIWAVVAYVLSISRAPAQEVPTSVAASPQNAPALSGDLPESLIGNPMRGEELFFASSQGKANEKGCAGCHSIDGRGNSVGPDLTGSARKKPKDLLRDIVFPSAQVDSGYRAFRITMKDGETILGLKREETSTALRVYDTSSNPPVLRRLPNDRIQTVEPQSHSVMPSSYGALYTLRQLLDLVSFLKSSGAASPVKVNFLDLQ